MLKKLPRLTFVAGTNGQPGHDAYEVCPGVPPSGTPGVGRWEQRCAVETVLYGMQSGPALGRYPPETGPWPKPIFVQAYVCKSVWTP